MTAQVNASSCEANASSQKLGMHFPKQTTQNAFSEQTDAMRLQCRKHSTNARMHFLANKTKNQRENRAKKRSLLGRLKRNVVKCPLNMLKMITVSYLTCFGGYLATPSQQRRLTTANLEKQDSTQFKKDFSEGISEMRTIIGNFIPANVRDTLIATTIIASLCTLILSIVQFAKRGTVLTTAILCTSVFTFISSILVTAKYDEESEITEFIDNMTQFPELLTENYDERVLQFTEEGDPNTDDQLTERELEFLKTVKNQIPVNKFGINQIHYRQFNDVILPTSSPPSAVTPTTTRGYRMDFRYPNWFLRAFWFQDYQSALQCKLIPGKEKSTTDTVCRMRLMLQRTSENADEEDTLADNIIINDDDELPSPSQTNRDKLKKQLETVAKDVQTETEQDVLKFIKKICYKIVCILIYIFDVTTTKQKFSVSGLLKAFRLVDDVNREGNDLKELYCLIVGKESFTKQLTNKMEKYRDEFQKFMEVPTFKLAEDQTQVFKMKDTIKQFNDDIYTLSKEQKQDFQSISQLSLSVVSRIQTFFQHDIKQLSRQEPFVVMVQGSGGIGKTAMLRKLAKKFCEEKLGLEYATNYCEITPDDKYWPPFQGQTIAFFDDCATTQDLKEDLLLKNIKNICAPTMFNAAGADVNHKINPINFRVVFATTNTSFKDIGTRLTSIYDASTTESCFRRMICVKAEWNPRCGNLDIDKPWTNGYKEDDSHLSLSLIKYDKGNANVVKKISKADLLERIVEKEAFYNRNYNQWKARLNLEKQAESKTHFSINFNGRAGQGKTEASKKLMTSLAITLNMPSFYIASFTELAKFKCKNKCIIVLDDILRVGLTIDEENLLMDLYNSKLQNNSVIIWTTNVSPTKTLPQFTGTALVNQRKLDFSNEGLIRRAGYAGFFNGVQQPTTGCEFRVNNMRYYEIFDQTALTLQMIAQNKIASIIFGLLFLLHVYYTYIPFAFFCIAFYFRMLEREIDYQNLPEYLFQRYRTFVFNRSSISVEYTDEIPISTDFNLYIECKDSSQFMNVTNAMEADKHVFIDFNRFCQANNTWKIFMNHEVMVEMQKNVERYMLNSYNFDEDSVIALISRYVQAFAAANIIPKFYAHFDDIGTFHFEHNVLKIKRLSSSNLDISTSKPSITFYDGTYQLYFRNEFIKFNEVLNMDSTIAAMKGFTYKESEIFFSYVKSPQFLQNTYYLAWLKTHTKNQIKAKFLIEGKRLKDKIQSFITHPFGIAVVAIIGLVTSIFLAIMIKKMFKSSDSDDDSSDDEEVQRKKSRKGTPKKKNYDSDDDKVQQRKKSRKGSPKKKNYDSDDDKIHEKKKSRKGSPKKKSYDSDDDYEKQDVLKLTDMNEFKALKPYFSMAHQKARKNLCQVYSNESGKDILTSEPETRLCYGLFLKDTMFVTVGHVVNEFKNTLYVGKDEFDGKYYKATFVCKPTNRDISIWKIKGVTKQPDITSLFLKDSFYTEDDEWNAVLQRFAPGKIEEYHTSSFSFWQGPQSFDCNGVLTKFGQATYAAFGIKLTDGGDCGLPYYIAERSPVLSNKILGIHCMGNTEGHISVGILSVITQQDIAQWTKTLAQSEKQQLQCNFCGNETIIKNDDKPKCKNHRTVWHKNHDSTWSTFYEEYQTFVERYPTFVGGIMKNSGSLKGSESHSHTQFLPFVNDVVDSDVSPWKTIDLTTLCKKLSGEGSQITVEIASKNLFKYLKQYHKFGNDFRLRIYRYLPMKDIGDYKLRLQITINHLTGDFQTEVNDIVTGQNKQMTFTPHFGDPIHVDPAMYAVLQGSINNKERGKLEDVPFANVDDNQTVKVIGSFCQSKSHVPNNHYKKSPFSDAIKHIIPIDKLPCEYDISKIPAEFVDKMAKNNYGQPCQRSTLSLAWAHKIAGSRMDFKEIKEEFRVKIKSFYSGLRLLTDEEVLGGIKEGNYTGYVNGMELDTSIGFMMKELFYVNKKRDVLACDENGNYSWQNNEAASYLKKQYEQAKSLSDNGNKYCAIFLELLKMEKLKIEGGKQYKGRTFVAQDTLGVLMERRNLGYLCAKAYKDDPNCGIGVDPIKTFNRIYIRLQKFPNIWAGDYKNFDRNTPALVQQIITELLCEENPKIANQIKATMKTNIERLQVSGTTLFEVYGGMPSGCFTTAPLNSLNNEFLMYSCFHFLCLENGIAPTWKLYNENIERIYYGDDVMVSVSDAFKDIFTRSNVSKLMATYFGMTLDSSAKDGSDSVFDTYDTASWISRYFRKLGKYDIQCGALKKISIHANFHHVSSTELEHMGSLMERAQWEAALWEPEFFDKIQEAITICLRKKPALGKYVQLYSQKTIQKQMFDSAITTAFPYAKEIQSWNDVIGDELATPVQQGLNFFRKYLFKNNYQKRVINRIMANKQIENFGEKIAVSYTMKLNEYSQQGKIMKPKMTYTSEGPTNEIVWYATCDTTRSADCKQFQSNGIGATKAEAREGAAYDMLVQLEVIEPLERKRFLSTQLETQMRKPALPWSCFVPQMNMTPGTVGQTPKAPLMQTDVSVVADAGLFTNTQIPTPMRTYNATAIALDNPAGSGAPFDKKVSIYNIYQRWEDNNTTISPSMSSGARVLTLSLDPLKLPTYIKEYILFHDSIIPAIDISISIAGAAGTIGWLSVGWVKDGSKQDISLNDLQQVSCETTNMNGTQIINTKLTDVRRMGLFRKVKDDPEPYPAIVMLIDHAVTNVQRNDSVNYPVRVQVKLAPECVLMEPFSRGADVPTTAKFNLGSYFYDNQVDLLVGSSSITQESTSLNSHPDHGFNTDNFKPIFGARITSVVKNYEKSYIMCAVTDSTPDATFLDQLQNQTSLPDPSTNDVMPAQKIIMAFGDVEKIEPYYEREEPTLIGSVYTVNTYCHIGNIRYNVSKIVVQPGGCYVIGEAQYNIQSFPKGDFLIYTGCKEKVWQAQFFKDAYQPALGLVRKIAVFYKDPNHNNVAVGDEFTTYTSTASNEYWLKQNDTTLNDDLKTYVQTGNSMPATALPTGLKQLSFVRSGTTTKVSADQPFVPIYKPVLKNAVTAFTELIQENGMDMAKGNIIVNGENKGEIGFQNGIFFVRTDAYKKILPRIGNDVKITNISALSSPQALAVFNTTSLQDWITSSRRYRNLINFSGLELQSAIAGGAIMGLGQGLSEWSKQMFQSQMLEKMQRANAAMQGANNAALAKRQEDAFKRNLELTGYNSSSSQFGLIGPRQENHMNTSLYRNLESSFHQGETLNPTSSTQGNISFDNKGSAIIDVSKEILDPPIHEVTKFQENPIFEPAPRNQLIENSAAQDVEPIDPALDKETANPISNTVVHKQAPNMRI